MDKVLFTVVYQDNERNEEIMVHSFVVLSDSVLCPASVECHIAWDCEDMDINPSDILKMIYQLDDVLYVAEYNGYPGFVERKTVG